MIAQEKHEKSTLIIDTIKMVNSEKWYGCSDIIEIAKGKNAIPKNWKEAKEKIRRARFMETEKAKEGSVNSFKKIKSWLTKRK